MNALSFQPPLSPDSENPLATPKEQSIPSQPHARNANLHSQPVDSDSLDCKEEFGAEPDYDNEEGQPIREVDADVKTENEGFGFGQNTKTAGENDTVSIKQPGDRRNAESTKKPFPEKRTSTRDVLKKYANSYFKEEPNMVKTDSSFGVKRKSFGRKTAETSNKVRVDIREKSSGIGGNLLPETGVTAISKKLFPLTTKPKEGITDPKPARITHPLSINTKVVPSVHVVPCKIQDQNDLLSISVGLTSKHTSQIHSGPINREEEPPSETQLRAMNHQLETEEESNLIEQQIDEKMSTAGEGKSVSKTSKSLARGMKIANVKTSNSLFKKPHNLNLSSSKADFKRNLSSVSHSNKQTGVDRKPQISSGLHRPSNLTTYNPRLRTCINDILNPKKDEIMAKFLTSKVQTHAIPTSPIIANFVKPTLSDPIHVPQAFSKSKHAECSLINSPNPPRSKATPGRPSSAQVRTNDPKNPQMGNPKKSIISTTDKAFGFPKPLCDRCDAKTEAILANEQSQKPRKTKATINYEQCSHSIVAEYIKNPESIRRYSEKKENFHNDDYKRMATEKQRISELKIRQSKLKFAVEKEAADKIKKQENDIRPVLDYNKDYVL
jgi:hypothetical protein